MIRKATIKDIDTIANIDKQIFRDGIYTKEQFNYELKENKFAHFYVDEIDNKISGYLIYMITFNSATIVKIGIDKNFVKQGIATNLLKRMENNIKKKGYGKIENITLEVRENNLPALSLYKKNGYREVCLKKHYYQNGDNAVYMMKVLL